MLKNDLELSVKGLVSTAWCTGVLSNELRLFLEKKLLEN